MPTLIRGCANLKSPTSSDAMSRRRCSWRRVPRAWAGLFDTAVACRALGSPSSRAETTRSAPADGRAWWPAGATALRPATEIVRARAHAAHCVRAQLPAAMRAAGQAHALTRSMGHHLLPNRRLSRSPRRGLHHCPGVSSLGCLREGLRGWTPCAPLPFLKLRRDVYIRPAQNSLHNTK
jgi:hypothetical protein